MKRFLDIPVAICISVEMVVCLSILGMYLSAPALLATIGSYIAAGPEGTKFLALVPLGLLGLVIKEEAHLLHPEGPLGEAFQQWPYYRMVQDRYWIIVVTLFLCAVVAVALWFTAVNFTKPAHLCLFFGALIVAIVSYAHFFVAKVTLRRILATAPKDKVSERDVR